MMNITQRSSIASPAIWLAGIYIRLSRADGNDISSSVIHQEKILKNHIETLKTTENIQIFDYYIDDGVSGINDSRTAFQRLLRDVEDGTINCILIKDLSRLFRNMADQSYYLEEKFPLHNIRLISLSQPSIDSYLDPDSLDDISVAMQGIFNQNHPMATSKNVRCVLDAKRKNGDFIGSFAPYGYQKDPRNKNHLIVDDEAAGVVRNIYDWYVSGYSKNAIVNKLNELGVLNPTTYKKSKQLNYCNPHARHPVGFLWSARTVDAILKNQVYIGDMVQGKQKVVSYKTSKVVNLPQEEWYIVRHTHAPIVDEKTFQKAQSILKMHTKRQSDSGEISLFSGLLKCADCQKAMSRSKSTAVYYVCKTYKYQSKKECSRHSFREDLLTQTVLKVVQTQILLMDQIDQLIVQVANEFSAKHQATLLEALLAEKKLEINKANALRDGLYLDWKNNDITHEDYIRLRHTQDQRLAQLKENQSNIQEEIKSLRNHSHQNRPDFEAFQTNKTINNLNRGLLLSLVESIHIYENQKITIRFRYLDHHKPLLSLWESTDNRIYTKPNSQCPSTHDANASTTPASPPLMSVPS